MSRVQVLLTSGCSLADNYLASELEVTCTITTMLPYLAPYSKGEDDMVGLPLMLGLWCLCGACTCHSFNWAVILVIVLLVGYLRVQY